MSLVMADSGHKIIAEALFDETFHLTWGTLPADYPEIWTVDDELVPNYTLREVSHPTTKILGATDSLDLFASRVFAVSHIVDEDNVTYVLDTDFTVDTTGTKVVINWLPDGAAPDVGKVFSLVYTHKYSLSDETEVIQAVGYRKATQKQYVVEDPDGGIEANGKRWSISLTPTANLYLQFRFAGDDAVGAVIYQFAIRMNLQPNSGLENVHYLLPDEVADKGELFMISNAKPFARNSAIRENYEIVINL